MARYAALQDTAGHPGTDENGRLLSGRPAVRIRPVTPENAAALKGCGILFIPSRSRPPPTGIRPAQLRKLCCADFRRQPAFAQRTTTRLAPPMVQVKSVRSQPLPETT